MVGVSGSKPPSSSASASASAAIVELVGGKSEKGGRVRVKKKTLQAMLEQFQRAIESIDNSGGGVDDDDDDDDSDVDDEEEEESAEGSSSSSIDRETDELCDLVKSRVECADFLKKLESVQGSVPQNMAEDGNSWDMVGDNDLWEDGNTDPDQDDYVLVRQEDIVDGIACFMAAYLLSLKETKDLNPSQLQEALSKTFSVKKRKGKLMKAWDGSKVIYNVASWGATAIGIYQNPALLRAASTAFWTSCRVISKLF